MKHFLLLYETVADFKERRGQFRAEHLRAAWALHAEGRLLLGGAFADPPGGAALLFLAPARETVEDFARADPYVVNGLVTRWSVREWSTVVGEEATTPIWP